MDTPKFSILVPVYNGEKTIARAVDSALKQTCSDFELLICDDGSTDGTWEILERYAGQDSRIRLFKQERNKGGICTRNTLIRNFVGEYCVWLDADDELMPEALETGNRILAEKEWDVIQFPHVTREMSGQESVAPYWRSFEERGDSCIGIYFTKIQHRHTLWGKVIRGEVMKQAIAPDVRAFSDDLFFALPMAYFAKSWTCRAEKPMYVYCLGTGFFSQYYGYKKLEDVKKLILLKRQAYAYHASFMQHHGIKFDPMQLILALDVGQHLLDVLVLEDVRERVAGLDYFQRLFGVSLYPAPYSQPFYPPGCEPKRFTYTFR